MKWVSVLALLVACSKPNPEVCCLSTEDCASIGVDDGTRACNTGLACVDHACVVPSCSTDGCGPEAPVCEITTDVCGACVDSSSCARFPDTSLCDPDSGACVECVTDVDCTTDRPVCDAGACRSCQLDSECASGATSSTWIRTARMPGRVHARHPARACSSVSGRPRLRAITW